MLKELRGREGWWSGQLEVEARFVVQQRVEGEGGGGFGQLEGGGWDLSQLPFCPEAHRVGGQPGAAL